MIAMENLITYASTRQNFEGSPINSIKAQLPQAASLGEKNTVLKYDNLGNVSNFYP
jgi:hypothetical protein